MIEKKAYNIIRQYTITQFYKTFSFVTGATCKYAKAFVPENLFRLV